MSKCICIQCKDVVSDTCNQNHVLIIPTETLDVLEITTSGKDLADIRFEELKTNSKTACLCQNCYKEL